MVTNGSLSTIAGVMLRVSPSYSCMRNSKNSTTLRRQASTTNSVICLFSPDTLTPHHTCGTQDKPAWACVAPDESAVGEDDDGEEEADDMEDSGNNEEEGGEEEKPTERDECVTLDDTT